ncbi:hypothetical protein PR048_004366 [Dryococelus australis]|uniref:Uncharacterized protein n=1 Tax=Dryococelus australis TaxID=614101 RepID=A0ABQ9I582_9NEOP|nr:hypothetical protein PR048_004366 [Dryococelus australis]
MENNTCLLSAAAIRTIMIQASNAPSPLRAGRAVSSSYCVCLWNFKRRPLSCSCGNRAGRCRWPAGFLGDLPFSPPYNSGASSYSPQSPTSALKTSMLTAVQIYSLPYLLSLCWWKICSKLQCMSLEHLCLNKWLWNGVSSVHNVLKVIDKHSQKCAFSWTRAAVTERLTRSPPTKANRAQSPAGSPDFRMWESCRTMPSIGGFSRGSSISPAFSFLRCSILTSITLIGSQDLDVKSRPKPFTHPITVAAKLSTRYLQ